MIMTIFYCLGLFSLGLMTGATVVGIIIVVLSNDPT